MIMIKTTKPSRYHSHSVNCAVCIQHSTRARMSQNLEKTNKAKWNVIRKDKLERAFE